MFAVQNAQQSNNVKQALRICSTFFFIFVQQQHTKMFKGNIFWMIIKTNNFYLKTRFKYLFSCLSTSFKKKNTVYLITNSLLEEIKQKRERFIILRDFYLTSNEKNLYAVRDFPDHFDILIDVHVTKRMIYRYLVWPTVLELDVLTIDSFVCQKCAKKQSFGTLLD